MPDIDSTEWDKENWDEELTPHAGNLGTSLQGLTYDFEKAIADVVDNSICLLYTSPSPRD